MVPLQCIHLASLRVSARIHPCTVCPDGAALTIRIQAFWAMNGLAGQLHCELCSLTAGKRSLRYALDRVVANSYCCRRGHLHGSAQPPHSELAGASLPAGGDRDFSLAA